MSRTIDVEVSGGTTVTINLWPGSPAEQAFDIYDADPTDDNLSALEVWIKDDVIDAMSIEITGAWE